MRTFGVGKICGFRTQNDQDSAHGGNARARQRPLASYYRWHPSLQRFLLLALYRCIFILSQSRSVGQTCTARHSSSACQNIVYIARDRRSLSGDLRPTVATI